NDTSGSVNDVIGKALLTVTGDNQTKYCGHTNPDFTVGYSGFVPGEDEDFLHTKPVATTSADINSTGTGYDIVPSGGVDNNYSFNYVNGTLTINSVTIDASDSSSPVQVGNTATLKASVSPAVSGVQINFYLNGELKGSNLSDGNGIATLEVSGLGVDVYKVTAIAGGGCSESIAYLPVYDPNGGFVTGGGWIYSNPGNMSGAMASAQGKANFGFNAKYKNGKNNMNEVDGNTNFQFKAGDVDFKSTSHDDMSLVISGAKATYRGHGTINGTGDHKFLLIAVDGDVNGGGIDKFRIKIWKDNSNEVLYDNQWATDENSDAATQLGGGSIVIHKPKGNNKSSENVVTNPTIIMQDLNPEVLETFALSPNPVVTSASIRFTLKEDSNVQLNIYDFSGRLIETLFEGKVNANQVYEVGFERRNLMSGTYIYKLFTDKGQSFAKRLIIK
ncbi:MAG: MBG domain-containing protein, partial [Gillisia sp.]